MCLTIASPRPVPIVELRGLRGRTARTGGQLLLGRRRRRCRDDEAALAAAVAAGDRAGRARPRVPDRVLDQVLDDDLEHPRAQRQLERRRAVHPERDPGELGAVGDLADDPVEHRQGADRAERDHGSPALELAEEEHVVDQLADPDDLGAAAADQVCLVGPGERARSPAARAGVRAGCAARARRRR